jgi:hypothetical protein
MSPRIRPTANRDVGCENNPASNSRRIEPHGVGRCRCDKFLAKIASDWHKPNGLFVIHPLKCKLSPDTSREPHFLCFVQVQISRLRQEKRWSNFKEDSRIERTYLGIRRRNTAVSRALDPVRMASAFAVAIRGGRSAFLAGPMSVQKSLLRGSLR